MELATIMAFSLSWWNYPLIALVTFGSVWLAYRLENWRESKADPGPYPCLTHLGRCGAGWDIWCWKQAWHTDSHDHPHLYTECTEVRRYESDRYQGISVVPETEDAPASGCDGSCCDGDGSYRQTDAAGNVVIDESPGYLPYGK